MLQNHLLRLKSKTVGFKRSKSLCILKKHGRRWAVHLYTSVHFWNVVYIYKAFASISFNIHHCGKIILTAVPIPHPNLSEIQRCRANCEDWGGGWFRTGTEVCRGDGKYAGKENEIGQGESIPSTASIISWISPSSCSSSCYRSFEYTRYEMSVRLLHICSLAFWSRSPSPAALLDTFPPCSQQCLW